MAAAGPAARRRWWWCCWWCWRDVRRRGWSRCEKGPRCSGKGRSRKGSPLDVAAGVEAGTAAASADGGSAARAKFTAGGVFSAVEGTAGGVGVPAVVVFSGDRGTSAVGCGFASSTPVPSLRAGWRIPLAENSPTSRHTVTTGAEQRCSRLRRLSIGDKTDWHTPSARCGFLLLCVCAQDD